MDGGRVQPPRACRQRHGAGEHGVHPICNPAAAGASGGVRQCERAVRIPRGAVRAHARRHLGDGWRHWQLHRRRGQPGHHVRASAPRAAPAAASGRDAPVALVCVERGCARARVGEHASASASAHATWITPRILEVPRIIARARAARVCDGRAATLRRFRGRRYPRRRSSRTLPSAIFPGKKYLPSFGARADRLHASSGANAG